MTYSPQTWHDLPVEDTPINAARLSFMENGIAAAHAAAAVAQATADAATGGGDSTAIPGLALNGTTDDGPAIQAALDAVDAGTSGAHLKVHGTAGKVCYVDSIIQMSTSNTILDSDVDFLWGPNAKFQMFGETVEVPETLKPKLTADAAVGATVLHLSDVSYFSAGDYVGIRGNRDASGKPLQIFHMTVTAVNSGALTITIDPPLDETYLQTNPTTWSNKFSQVTRVISSVMTGTPTRGDLVIPVVSSTSFAVGDPVQCIDDTHTLGDGGAVQTGNFVHKEQAIITVIPDSTHVQISHPLFHSYDITKNARVAKLRTVNNSEICNWSVTFASTPTVTSNAFEQRYTYGSRGRNLVVKGTGTGGASWKTQAFRLTDTLASSFDDCRASGADDVTAGRGYGATFYGATLSFIRGGLFTSCRHSVLWFNGASGCIAQGVMSEDARISDFDWHGADCNDNMAIGCEAVGGNQNTPDSSIRTAFKWGNPSHVDPGDNRNVAIGCKVTSYAGVAIEGIPGGLENAFRDGEVRGALVGIKLGNLVASTTLPVSLEVTGTSFYDVVTPFQIDGGTAKVVKPLIDNNSWHRSGPFAITNATKPRILRNRVIDPATTTDYVVTATGCPNIQVKFNDFSDAYKGVKLTGCTSARVTDNSMHDLTGSTTVFNDNGGNGGYAFIWNRFLGFTPATTATGTGPSLGTLDISDGLGGGGGGGGGGTYPPAGGVPYADLDSALQTALTNAAAAYVLPGTGIPKTDMTSTVQTSLGKADTAYQLPGGGIPDSDLATPGGTDGTWDSATEHGYGDWTFDPMVVSTTSGAASTSGRLEMARIQVRSSGTRTHVVLGVGTVASGLTGAYVGVFDLSGTLIAVTADISSNLLATGVKSLATVSSYSTVAGTDVYLAVLQVGSTPAALYRATPSGALANAGLTAGTGYRFMSIGSGGTYTTMPSSVTLSTGTSSANTYLLATS